MHAQARRGIDFDDAPALRFERLLNRRADHVDSADVESDHPSRFHSTFSQFGVDLIGNVSRGSAGAQIAVIAQNDALTRGRNAFH
jgi:hypothetical protein